MKKKILFIISILTFSICYAQEEVEGYEIDGVIKNAPDSSIIELWIGKEIVDSTLIINEKFQFTGKVNEPTKVDFSIRNIREFKNPLARKQ